ncbi:hypothetical protein HOF65_03810 [bacterium]|nr:hypothetical protein [bacterium]MBT3853099.1 hypothetical protein [bacterium]
MNKLVKSFLVESSTFIFSALFNTFSGKFNFDQASIIKLFTFIFLSHSLPIISLIVHSGFFQLHFVT